MKLPQQMKDLARKIEVASQMDREIDAAVRDKTIAEACERGIEVFKRLDAIPSEEESFVAILDLSVEDFGTIVVLSRRISELQEIIAGARLAVRLSSREEALAEAKAAFAAMNANQGPLS